MEEFIEGYDSWYDVREGEPGTDVCEESNATAVTMLEAAGAAIQIGGGGEVASNWMGAAAGIGVWRQHNGCPGTG